MEEIIKKLAKAIDKVAGEVGKIEKDLNNRWNEKTPEIIKEILKDPTILLENHSKMLSSKKIIKFLEKKGEGVSFVEIFDFLIKLKLEKVFTSSNKKTSKKSSPKKKTATKKKPAGKKVAKKVVKKKSAKKKSKRSL